MDYSNSRYRQSARELDSRLTALETTPYPPPRTRILALASAAAAAGDREALQVVLSLAPSRKVSPGALGEALLQIHLFAGFPRGINAMAELAAVYPLPQGAAVDLSVRGEEQEQLEAGQAFCGRVYGSRYPRLLESMSRISPELGRWMILEGYGKVLSRPGLSSLDRELCAVSALLPLEVPSQLRAHLRGSLLLGASREEVEGILETAALIAPPTLAPAKELLAGLTP